MRRAPLLLALPALIPLTPTPTAAGEGVALRFGAELEEKYDDNILQLSQRDLDRLAQGQTGNDRFLVTTPDDRITVLELLGQARLRLFPRRATVFTARAELARYARNDVKDFEEYSLTLDQEITASRRNLGMLHVFASRTPDYYLRQLTDDDASFAAGRRIRSAASYSQDEAGVAYQQEFFGGRLGGWVERTMVRRDYVSSFDERDGRDDRSGMGLRMRPLPRWRGSFAVAWERGTMRAHGDLPSSEIVDDDVSYRHTGVSYALALPFFRRAPLRLEIELERENREYLTQNVYESSRYGRVNRRTRSSVRVVQRLFHSVDVTASWERLESDASFPTGFDPGDDVSDFEQTRLSLGLRARTNWVGER